MKSAWHARIQRANELSSAYPFAGEALRFYARVAMLQQDLYCKFQQAPKGFFNLNDSLFGRLNLSALAQEFCNFLRHVREIAPPVLAKSADELVQKDSASWLPLIEECWLSPITSEEQYEDHEEVAGRCLAWLFLQPCAEYLASRKTRTVADGSPTRCPMCGAKPIVGVLRPEGEGARKSLICMLCAHEWRFRRIYCPSCGEEREPHMAFYSAPEIPHVRIDVCDTCHTYVKSVDLTKSGLAVPIVDELLALPLDLWAREKGYRKLQINIVGI